MDFIKELLNCGLTQEQYDACLKDIRDKINHINDYDWADIVEKYNLPFHPDVVRKASSNKPFGWVFVTDYLAEKQALSSADEAYLKILRSERQELRKEKQQLQDERMELSRLLREQARRESFIDLVKRVMAEEVAPLPPTENKSVRGASSTDSDMIICISDIHAGIKVNSSFNEYNMGVVKTRLDKYQDDIAKICETHKCKEAHLVLGGDLISGLIHANLRLQNNEHCIDQVKQVSILLGSFACNIAGMFDHLCIHSVSGNHSRLTPSKEDEIKGENLDALVPFYLELLLKGFENVSFSKNTIDDTIVAFKTRGGYLFYAVHGDKDKPSTVVKNLTLMTGVKPDAIILSHRHHTAYNTEHSVKIIQTGSIVGMDDYCVDNRISGRPEQTVVITDADNVVRCFYDIGL